MDVIKYLQGAANGKWKTHVWNPDSMKNKGVVSWGIRVKEEDTTIWDATTNERAVQQLLNISFYITNESLSKWENHTIQKKPICGAWKIVVKQQNRITIFYYCKHVHYVLKNKVIWGQLQLYSLFQIMPPNGLPTKVWYEKEEKHFRVFVLCL